MDGEERLLISPHCSKAGLAGMMILETAGGKRKAGEGWESTVPGVDTAPWSPEHWTT